MSLHVLKSINQCFTSSKVSSGNSGVVNVIGCCSLLLVSLKNVWKLPISDISGSVIALVPNGIIGECLMLLLSERLGLLKIGTLAKGPLRTGGEVPRRKNEEPHRNIMQAVKQI